MRLSFIYQSVNDLPAALAFYRDQLGFDEAWREGESTVALELPGSPVQLMLDVPIDGGDQWTSGAFFMVDDVDEFVGSHPGLKWVGKVVDMPGGKLASFADPSDNVIHIADQARDGD